MDIKSVIKQRGYTIEQVSHLMGVSRNTLFVTIHGNPTIKTLQRVADAIGCRVGDFFKDETTEGGRVICPHCGKIINIKIEVK